MPTRIEDDDEDEGLVHAGLQPHGIRSSEATVTPQFGVAARPLGPNGGAGFAIVPR
jgi:hypothetical protein